MIQFEKCAIDDVSIECTITATELNVEAVQYDDNMSVTSANTVRVESFWLDPEDQKSPSPMSNGTPRVHRRRGKDRTHSYPDDDDHESHRSESILSPDSNEHYRNRSAQSNGFQGSSNRINAPFLSDQNLAAFNGKPREMANFRIKHAMDVMADEHDQHRFNMADLYALYDKEQKEVVRIREKVDGLNQELKEKNAEIRHFHEEERKWNKSMVEWEREKSNFEASTIELNFKYQREKEDHRKCQHDLSEITLRTKKIILQRDMIDEKYTKLMATLKDDGNPLVQQLSQLQTDYDDLEESLIRQQNSWRETGNILETELDKQRRKTLKAVNELKKYKQRYERSKKENLKIQQKVELLQRELFEVKSQSEIKMAQIKFEANQKLVANTNMLNKLMMSSQRNTNLEQLVTKMANHEGQHVQDDVMSPGKCTPNELNEVDEREIEPEEDPEIEFYDDVDDEEEVDDQKEREEEEIVRIHEPETPDGDDHDVEIKEQEVVIKMQDDKSVDLEPVSPEQPRRATTTSRRSSLKSEPSVKNAAKHRKSKSSKSSDSIQSPKPKSTKAQRKKNGKHKKKPSLNAKHSNQSNKSTSSNESSVSANIRKFDSKKGAETKSAAKKKKRRNSTALLKGKGKGKQQKTNGDKKNKKKEKKRRKSTFQNREPSREQAEASPIPSRPPPSIEKAENTLIEQELLSSPIRKNVVQHEMEGMHNGSLNSAHEIEKNGRGHYHVRTSNSTSLQNIQASLIFDGGSEPEENESDLSELENANQQNENDTVQEID